MGGVAAEAIEAVNPAGEISGAVGDDALRPQLIAQPHHDLAEIDGARLRRRLAGPGEEIVMRGLGARAPFDLVGRLQAFERRAEAGRRGMDRQMR